MNDLSDELECPRMPEFACGGNGTLHRAIFRGPGPTYGKTVVVKFPHLWRVASINGLDEGEGRQRVFERWNRELKASQSVSHPNVVPILGVCANPNPGYKDFKGIVLPYCRNRDAKMYLQGRAGADRLRILVCVCAALFALHIRPSPVVHGDIKASNILIDDHGEPLLADFGQSRIYNVRGFTTENWMRSTRWTSVELLRAEAGFSESGISVEDGIVRVTTASDIWAVAMTIWEVLTGEVPFADLKETAVLVGLITGKICPSKPLTNQISDAVWTLLEHCWKEDAHSRPDARHVGLTLDVIYGLGSEIDSQIVSDILEGRMDNVFDQTSRDDLEPTELPYKCKWMHCTQSFENIDACVAHECAEYKWRSAEAFR